jgi:aminoglycoside phosphotransferase (APT) family kinase protein
MDAGVDADRLVRRLVDRGLIKAAGPITAERLPGGVSADVFLITVGRRRLVAKRALERLRVAQEWRSSPRRVLREAEAMTFAREIRPENVPEVLDLDVEHLVITMAAAPASMKNWKTELLSGPSRDQTLAEELGRALADWHSTSAKPSVSAIFADATNFFELRIAPFFHRIAEVHSDLAGVIGEVVDRMNRRPICLVHGDFSPKNVLHDDARFMVLDWETAHRGDPTFDLAFLESHLICKALHRPSGAEGYRSDADALVAAYLERGLLEVDVSDLVAQVGCLVLARVDGKSPVDYLDADQQELARALARSVLTDRPSRAEIWTML